MIKEVDRDGLIAKVAKLFSHFVKEIKTKEQARACSFVLIDFQVEAWGGFEPPNNGFADRRVSHFATRPPADGINVYLENLSI